jgi:hypothetical protein
MRVLKQIIIFLSIILITNQCNNSSDSHITSESNDSLKPEIVKNNNEKRINDTMDEDDSTGDIINEYIKEYQKKVAFDTSYIVNTDTFRVNFKHYCLMDSSIIVPKKYVEIYGLDSFVTHNFESELKVRKNDNLVFNKIIKKHQFDKYLDDNLRKYGALLYPEASIKNTLLEIDYSISIPLTDVGVRIEMTVNSDGKVEIKKY